MTTRSLKARLEALEQTAIVLWRAEAAREAEIAARPQPPAYTAVLDGIDRVLAAIAVGQVEAINGIQIQGKWYSYLRPWHCEDAEAEALRPWCDWIMSVLRNLPLDDQPYRTAEYTQWITAHREAIARRVAYPDDP